MTKSVTLPGGEQVPALGQGTWFMGEQAGKRADEIAALRAGIELGLTLVDTAEMYGDGATEKQVGAALKDGWREKAFLVSKVYPHNASRRGVVDACTRSLIRLGTDRLDLYLLHWRGSYPLEETIAGFEDLQKAGKIRHWGVSNLDTDDMEELLEAGGEACAVNQILYNPSRRGPEFDLLPFQARHKIPVMAYSPIEQARLPRGGALGAVAKKHGVDPFQVALAWVMRDPGVIAIPKAGRVAHVEANAAARDLKLDADDLAAIDADFPPPKRKRSLEML
ncbi:aldo/keto reductase [Azorhizobium oxalatiphilum]|uniref:Aldo/keto reductase n=1 Tax=Azorhizobium oxalatiphilum TaxID=980631 RepID=A0A917BUP5_9HYPH|nr:aldo/keto reductase [Azorhizobium oxalatiphilum]GGF56987.1 aldo/keto reductase [Azorhizobium oxalatiphilum]